MATAKKINKNQAINIVNHNIVIRPAQRSRKDIKDWRNAHKNAESSVLGTRIELYDLYDDILLDPHLSSLIDKRLMAVTNVKLRYMKDGEDVAELKDVLKSKHFKTLLKECLNSILWGVTVCELSFNPFKVWNAPRKHIRPRTGIIAYEQSGTTGVSYRDSMYANTVIEVGEPNDLGKLVKAVPYILYKRGCMGNWAQYAEVFGMPTKIGRYDGYDSNTRIALQKALDEAGAALSIVLPKEASLEFLESKTTTGSADLYKSLINLCDEQLSILILGQTETTKSSDSSGYAQGKIHAKTEDEINKDDRAFILSVLETSVTHILTQAGYPMEGGEWVFEDKEEDVTLKDRVEIDIKLKASGLPIDDDYFYIKYNIPKPDNYEQIKKEAAKKIENNTLALNTDLLHKLNDFFA